MDKLKDKLYQYRILVVIVCLCIIAGCGYGLYASFNNDKQSYVSHVSDGDKEVVKDDSVAVTKDDIYYYLLDNNGLNLTLNSAIEYVASQEIKDEDAINNKIAEIKQQYLQYTEGKDLNTYAKEVGYENEETLVKEVIKPNAKLQLLQEKYADNNFSKLVKSYKVKYLKYFTVDTESQALKIIKNIKDEASYTNYFNEYSGSDAGIVTSKSTSVDENIVKKLSKFTKDGIYSKAIKTSDSKYAVIWVYNSNINNVKAEIKEELMSLTDFATKCETYYLKKYQFDVYEPIIKEKIKETSEDYFE